MVTTTLAPSWARTERLADMVWITDNLHILWPAAFHEFRAQGRGVIVVDTTSRPRPDAGHPFGYYGVQHVAKSGNADALRMANEYEPTTEVVIMLLKRENRASTYRVQCRQQTSPTALFDLGQLVGTPGALEALESARAEPGALLSRHVRGDWGELDEEDKRSNADAVKNGLRILSAYTLPTGVKLWVITEADRSTTTLLLPAEY